MLALLVLAIPPHAYLQALFSNDRGVEECRIDGESPLKNEASASIQQIHLGAWIIESSDEHFWQCWSVFNE